MKGKATTEDFLSWLAYTGNIFPAANSSTVVTAINTSDRAGFSQLCNY